MEPEETEIKRPPSPIQTFFIPSKAEGALYITYAAILLAIINYRAIIQIVLNGSGVANFDSLVFSDSMTVAVYRTYEGLGTLSVMMLWGFVGGTIFALTWFFRSMSLSVREDIEAIHDLEDSTSKSRYVHSSIAKYIALFFSTVGIIIYILVLLNSLLPLFSRWVFSWYGSPSVQNWLMAPLAIFSLGLALYTLKLLVGVAKYTLRTISPK